jgi:hypothetical protein
MACAGYSIFLDFLLVHAYTQVRKFARSPKGRCANHRCTRNVAAYYRVLKSLICCLRAYCSGFSSSCQAGCDLKVGSRWRWTVEISVITQGSPQLPALFPCSRSKADENKHRYLPSGKHLSPILQASRMILAGAPESFCSVDLQTISRAAAQQSFG